MHRREATLDDVFLSLTRPPTTEEESLHDDLDRPSTTTAPGPARLRWLVADSLAIAGRSLAHIRQIPEKLLDVTLQPLMFVLLFAFVFGGVIAVPGGGDYHEYLIGGILVQTLVFGMMGPGPRWRPTSARASSTASARCR